MGHGLELAAVHQQAGTGILGFLGSLGGSLGSWFESLKSLGSLAVALLEQAEAEGVSQGLNGASSFRTRCCGCLVLPASDTWSHDADSSFLRACLGLIRQCRFQGGFEALPGRS